MATVWKDILYPGNWRLRDGRTFQCSPTELRHYASRMQEMIAAGLPIPLSWEHQPSVKPGGASDGSDEARAARAKFTLGHTSGVRADGGVLETKLEVPNDDDARRLPAVRFVSPYIEWDYVDGHGRKWDGPSITHIAVTPRPIQHTQKPFAMSADGDALVTEPVTIAGRRFYDRQIIPREIVSRLPVALSLADYEGPMDDEKDGGGKGAKAKSDPADDSGIDVADNAGLTPPEDQSARVAQMVEMLAAHKIVLGEGVTMDNFFDRLEASLGTKAAHDGSGPGRQQNPDVQAQATEVAMSADFNAMRARAERAEAKLIKAEHSALLGRIRALSASGRINKPLFEKLKREATAVSLSLDSAGELATIPLLSKVEAYEELPAGAMGAFSAAAALSTEVEPPESMLKDNRKAQEEAGDELAALAGAPVKKSA